MKAVDVYLFGTTRSKANKFYHRGPERAGRSRLSPQVRKVRAPQGRVLGNTQEGQPYGKCNREETADGRSSDFVTGKGETAR